MKTRRVSPAICMKTSTASLSEDIECCDRQWWKYEGKSIAQS